MALGLSVSGLQNLWLAVAAWVLALLLMAFAFFVPESRLQRLPILRRFVEKPKPQDLITEKNGTVRRHDGFSGTITDSFSTNGKPVGLAKPTDDDPS